MNRDASPDLRFSTRRCLLLIACCSPATVGCYEHVVSAKGYGTEGVTIHEPNLTDEPTDAERRLKRRQDLKNLNRSVPPAPQAYP